MLREGYLATNSVYISYFIKKDIDKYLKSCDKVFKLISNAVKNKKIIYMVILIYGFKTYRKFW